MLFYTWPFNSPTAFMSKAALFFKGRPMRSKKQDNETALALMRLIFPEAFKNGRLDFEELKRILPLESSFPSLVWNGKNAVKKCEKITLPADFDAQNAFICAETQPVLNALTQTHAGKISIAFINAPSPSADVLKAKPALLTKHLNDLLPVLSAVKILLKSNGCVFIFTNDSSCAYIKALCDETFGIGRHAATFVWQKKSAAANALKSPVNAMTQTILCYGALSGRAVGARAEKYPYEDEKGRYRLQSVEKNNDGVYARPSMRFDILGRKPPEGKRWSVGEQKARDLEKQNKFEICGASVKLKVYDFEESARVAAPNLLTNAGTAADGSKELNALLKTTVQERSVPAALYETLIEYTARENGAGLVLDAFAQTGASAQAVLETSVKQRRDLKFIAVQKPEKSRTKGFDDVCGIAEKRLRAAAQKLNIDFETQIAFIRKSPAKRAFSNK